MAQWDNESYNTSKSITTLVKTSAAAKSILLPPPLHYHAVKRLIIVDEDESIDADDEQEDELGEDIVEAASRLSFAEQQGSTHVSVDVAGSLAALFDRDCKLARDLKPRLWLAWDLSNDPNIQGMLTACEWSRDQSLGTERFTSKFCDDHSIPRLSANNCLFIDVVSSSRSKYGVGALLLLSAYLLVCRSKKYEFLATIAVTEQGRKLTEQIGMHAYSYREGGGKRSFSWCKANELTASDISRRLRVPSEIESVCFRDGYSHRTHHQKFSRCG
jgi:hypothetical protein